MTVYADHSFYTGSFHGKLIPAGDFDRAALLASQYLDSVTFGRIDPADVPEAVRYACCAVAEGYFSTEKASAASAGIASERVGDYQVSYAASGTGAIKSRNALLYEAAKLWLGETGLMYRGVFGHDD